MALLLILSRFFVCVICLGREGKDSSNIYFDHMVYQKKEKRPNPKKDAADADANV